MSLRHDRRLPLPGLGLTLALALLSPGSAVAQQRAAPSAAPAASVPPAGTTVYMERLAGRYVEGAGYKTFWGNADYEACARRCLADPKCVMIEVYRPQPKCHLYAHTKYDGRSRDADVGIKRVRPAAAGAGAPAASPASQPPKK